MNYKFIILIIVFSSWSFLYGEIKNPFGPVDEKILSKQIFFNNQPIEELNLLEITDTGSTRKAVIKGNKGISYKVNEGDFIGKDSGKIILIDEDRVVVLVRKKVGGKTVIRIEIIK